MKLTSVKPALQPPFGATLDTQVKNGEVILQGELLEKGDAGQLQVGFSYRPYAGFAEELSGGEWKVSELKTMSKPGKYSVQLNGLEDGKEYQFRSLIKHPKLEVAGDIRRFVYRKQ